MMLDDQVRFLESVEGVCRLGRFLVRRRLRCLLWSLQAVVDGWVRGRVLWKGGGSVNLWVEFGRKLRTGVEGIVEWVVLACSGD